MIQQVAEQKAECELRLNYVGHTVTVSPESGHRFERSLSNVSSVQSRSFVWDGPVFILLSDPCSWLLLHS